MFVSDSGIEEYEKWRVPSDIVSDSLKAHVTVIGNVLAKVKLTTKTIFVFGTQSYFFIIRNH